MNTKEKIDSALQILKADGNIIKTRDDRELIFINKDGEVQNTDVCSWLPDNGNVNKTVYRSRIEPWLTSLFQSEHLSLLCGSGITNAISFLAGATGCTTMGATTFTKYKNEIKEAAEASAKVTGRRTGNIEDQIRTANDLLRGLRILKKDDEATELETELNSIISDFAKSILKSENGIALADEEKRENAYSVLVNFLLSFASRTGNRERLNIFTTNYDRLIEVGTELAGIHLMDRFVGTMMPIFRSSRLNLDIHYNPPGIRGEPRYLEGVARLTKLHGSIDWIQNGGEMRGVGNNSRRFASVRKRIWDLANVAKKPFIASHSNAMTVCNHPRNLSDTQLRTIVSHGGIAGINLVKEHLSKALTAENPEGFDFDKVLETIVKHLLHFMEKGCEKNVCLGCDLDGTSPIKGLEKVSDIANIAKYMRSHGASASLVDDIFYNNAFSFFARNL